MHFSGLKFKKNWVVGIDDRDHQILMFTLRYERFEAKCSIGCSIRQSPVKSIHCDFENALKITAEVIYAYLILIIELKIIQNRI